MDHGAILQNTLSGSPPSASIRKLYLFVKVQIYAFVVGYYHAVNPPKRYIPLVITVVGKNLW